MALVNITSTGYNHTNQTGESNLTNLDWAKFEVFVNRLVLSVKIILILIIIFTILGNMLVLIATWKERTLHQPNKYFIACLAVADLLVGMFVAPLNLYQLYLDYKLRYRMSIHLCRFMAWIDIFSLATSIYTLTFISFDRYLKISKPFKYKSLMTRSTSLKVILVIVFISAACATYSAMPGSGIGGILVTGDGPCSQTSRTGYRFYNVLFIIAFLLPTVVMLIMYALIFLVTHKRQKRLRNGELGQTSTNLNQQTAILRQDMKVIRMLVIIVGVFLLCWSPWFISFFVFENYPNWNDLFSKSLSYLYRSYIIFFVASVLPLFNSLCNPVIYAWLDQKYREAFKHLFQRMICWLESKIA